MTPTREEYLRLADELGALAKYRVGKGLIDWERDTVARAATALRSAASIEPGEGWSVKALEWDDYMPGWHIASDVFHNEFYRLNLRGRSEDHREIIAEKANAQGLYERYIRSAISAPSPPQGADD